MTEQSKVIRRKLREFAGLAHEAELRQELGHLAAQFDEWRAGCLDSFELSDRIHEFHNGPSREIYNRYIALHRWNVITHGVEANLVSSGSR